MWIMPNVAEQFKQLDDLILTELLPAITGSINCCKIEQKLIALPPKFGGLGKPENQQNQQKGLCYRTN